jgi:hypothetical protein
MLLTLVNVNLRLLRAINLMLRKWLLDLRLSWNKLHIRQLARGVLVGILKSEESTK